MSFIATESDPITILQAKLATLEQRVQEQEQQLTEQRISLRLLVETNSRLDSVSDPAELAHHALRLICQELAVLRGEIFTVTAQGNLQILALNGYDEAQTRLLQENSEARLERGLARQVVQRAEMLIVPDMNCQDYWLPIAGLDDVICSAIGLPLRVDDQLIAVMCLLSEQAEYFTQARLPILTALTAPLALALQNAKLFRQVHTGEQQLRLFAGKLVYAQEEERQRIARELHDEAGQALTALKVALQTLQENLQDARPAYRHQLRAAIQLTTRTMERIHRLAYDLRPPELDTLGLDVALESLCAEVAQHTDLMIHYSGMDLSHLSDAASISFYRFVQEALTNVVKHAAATEVDVELQATSSQVWVRVADNGQGFQSPFIAGAPVTGQGLGLVGMQERFHALKGAVAIHSVPGQGTTLTATVQLEENP
ncbi:MAG: GAF domain-containing sensor histidine kinase [Caldilineaceae bacterium]|nr:GAF domain-containing sensor histidine kinase [Caldilineaceae bacterium]